MFVYIYIQNKVKVYNKKKIKLKHIAKIEASNELSKNIGEIIFFEIGDNLKKSFYIDLFIIVKKIKCEFPDIEIVSLGVNECIVEHVVREENVKNNVVEILKVMIVSLVLFAGGMTAIISFHTETELVAVLSNLYEVFTGESIQSPMLIGIPYSIGIGVGIIIFFNHVGNKKLTKDPSPIEIEMTQYEENVLQTTLNKLSNEEGE